MIKLWKFLSVPIILGVCLGLLLVPAMSVPAVANGPTLDVGIELHPSKAAVSFNEAFTADIYINNSANHVINAWGCNFTFTQSLINVTGITLNASVFNNVMPVDWSNTTGWAAMGALRTTTPSTNLSWIHVATIDMISNNVGLSGIAYLNFILGGVTNIAEYPSALNCLNSSLVVNATVGVGKVTLWVNVTPSDKGDVKINGAIPTTGYPNTTSWDINMIVPLEAVNSVLGWGFHNWTGDLNGTDSTESITMDGDKNVTANFAPLPPEICVSPSSLTVSVLPNGTANANYTITNCGGGTLNWNSSNVTYDPNGNMSWLSQNITSGSLNASESDTVLVTANATGLAEGTYNATINITGNSSVPLLVTLNVGLPAISVSPTSLSFTTTEGEDPPAKSLDVWNSGSGTLNWALSDNAGWLSESPTTGSSTGADDKTAVAVSVDVAGMAAGDYSATIEITDPAASNTPQTVSVSLHIESAMPEIPVEPASVSASSLSITPQQVEPGREVTISINVANTGGATGSYNAVLYINGVVEDSQSVSVAAGTTKNVIFTVSKSEAGVYDVLLAGQSGQFEVVGGGIFGGGLGTGGIIAIVVIVIVLIAAVVFILRGTTKPE